MTAKRGHEKRQLGYSQRQSSRSRLPMKIYALFILVILSCFISGCSTNTTPRFAAKYSDLPAQLGGCTNVVKQTPEEAERIQQWRDWMKICAAADLRLETENWKLFQETRPFHTSANREGLSKLFRNRKLVGHGVAVVVVPKYGPIMNPGDENPIERIESEVRQTLNDAGFVQVYFCTLLDTLNLE